MRKFLDQITLDHGLVQAVNFVLLADTDLPTSGVSAGSYTNVNLTVNAQGIVTAISNGSGGSSSITVSDNTTTLNTSALTVTGAGGLKAVVTGSGGNTNLTLTQAAGGSASPGGPAGAIQVDDPGGSGTFAALPGSGSDSLGNASFGASVTVANAFSSDGGLYASDGFGDFQFGLSSCAVCVHSGDWRHFQPRLRRIRDEYLLWPRARCRRRR